MTVVLALLGALAYGCSDFVGGIVSRRADAWPVAVLGCASTSVCTVAVAVFVPGEPTWADLGWATLAGLGSGAGVAFLYRGLARGRMGVVAPVSAVGAVVVPVAAGLIGGERPGVLVWLGILLAVPAIGLVSSTPADQAGSSSGASTGASSGLGDGLLAGIGFGLLFACVGQVPQDAGLWPLALIQVVSLPVVVLLATALGASWVPRGRPVLGALATGPFASAAVILFLIATHHGYLTVASVLASLYPAATVALAVVVLRERVHRLQAAGLALCAVTVALVAAG